MGSKELSGDQEFSLAGQGVLDHEHLLGHIIVDVELEIGREQAVQGVSISLG
jgi:hypothetical protein